MKKTLILALSSIVLSLNAQNVGIGTSTPLDYAKLDVSSTTSGFQLPRMTTAQRTTLGGNIAGLSAALSSQYSGMIVYDVSLLTMYMWDATKSTNGDWVNILDSDASVDDADADPINEIQDLSLTGNTLSLTDDTTTVDLSEFKDHDWYESTGTTQADNISDDVYTNGNVGVRDNDPTVPLSIVGQIRASDAADETEYVEIDHGGSNAYINWTGDGDLDVRRDGTNIVKFEQDGDLSMQDDNSVKMPNNIVYREDWGTSTNYNHDQWNNVSGYTSYMTVESGNILKLQFNLSTRLESGSGTDDFYFRIFVDGTGGCADSYSEELYYRPMEDGSEHDNFHPVSYLDILPVSCDGTMRFRLQMNNTGDDEYEVRDRALVVTKF